MGFLVSPGVQVNEIDLTNFIACTKRTSRRSGRHYF